MTRAPHPLAVIVSLSPWVWTELIASWLLLPLLAESLVTGELRPLTHGRRRQMLLPGLLCLLLTLLWQRFLPPWWQQLVHPLVSL